MSEMIRVGFELPDFSRWHAGFSYYRNLFTAVNALENPKIEAVILCGHKFNAVPFAKCVRHAIKNSLFDSRSVKNIADKLDTRLLQASNQQSSLFKRNNIPVISHSDITYKISYGRVINWIPDFQHIHLPDMFTDKDIKHRNNFFSKLIHYSDILLLSSFDAQNDLAVFCPEAIPKSRVLNFVAQPSPEIFLDINLHQLLNKYKVTSKYFFLPNQFWKHKNHSIVFKAIHLLKQRKKDVVVLCSGLMDDYRNSDHIDMLKSYINQNNLEDNIKCLGLIPYEDLCGLLRNSISVINPSLFEGWSTTVEECKSVGKSIILSNLCVHKEQAPPAGVYFDPHNPEELAEILWEKWSQSEGGSELELEQLAKDALQERTMKFAESFQDIVLESVI